MNMKRMVSEWRGVGVAVMVTALLAGCASFNATVFRSEKLATDSVDGGRQLWVQYYRQATNGASPQRLEELQKQLGQVQQVGTNFAASVLALDGARSAYQVDASDTNKAAVVIALDVVNANSTNFVNVVKGLLGPPKP